MSLAISLLKLIPEVHHLLSRNLTLAEERGQLAPHPAVPHPVTGQVDHLAGEGAIRDIDENQVKICFRHHNVRAQPCHTHHLRKRPVWLSQVLEGTRRLTAIKGATSNGS